MSRYIPAFLSLLLSGAALAAAPAFTTREQVESLLAGELASGSSVAMVTRFLDAHGIAHGNAEPSGPAMQLTGSVGGLHSKASRFTLQVRFSFLQDRMIGYSFTEVPAGDR
jgi:hypothetical protein